MGQVCSSVKSSEVSKDRDDKSLDPVEMKETKVPEFDELFTSAADPLNSLVDYNNGIVDAIENMKEASILIQGEAKASIKEKENKIVMTMLTMDEKGIEKVVEESSMQEKYDKSADLQMAADTVKGALQKLNEALVSAASPATKWKVAMGHLKIESKGGQDTEIRSLNRALFTFRKQLMLQAHYPGLKGAMTVLRKEMVDLGPECQPNVRLNDDNVPEIVFGEGDINLEKVGSKLPPRTKKLIEACDQFQQACTQTAEALPQLVEQLQEMVDKCAGFPDQAQEACTNAQLSPGEALKAIKHTNSNVKAIASGQQIAKGVASTMKEAANELKEACGSPPPGA